MKITLKQSAQWAMLAKMLRDFHNAVNTPWIARAFVYQKESIPDERLRRVICELVYCFGDWDKAKDNLNGRISGAWWTKLVNWAEKVRGK